MKLAELYKTERCSVESDVDGRRYGEAIKLLARYHFWPGSGSRKYGTLWEHQDAAISSCIAYLCSDRSIPAEEIRHEAALVKMATGTGKSAIIAVLSRCLPDIKRILILTPREALREQLYAYVRRGFWSKMRLCESTGKNQFDDDAGHMAGGVVHSAYINRFLPQNAGSILDADPLTDRMILVGTLQALDQVRRESLKDKPDPQAVTTPERFQDLIRLIEDFDLIIVDEGHYEPAISWSRAIREADRPTILFSATPYRNDYKSFRVRGRFVFNEPILRSIKKNKIRDPKFRPLAKVRPDLGEQPYLQVVATGRESEDTRRATPLQDADNTDASAFVDDLIAQQLPSLPAGMHPKVVIHASDFQKAELLQKCLTDRGQRALLVHHAVKKNNPARLQFNNVRSAQTISDADSVKYWVHQTKLLEGIDDSSIVAVGLYDAFGNARQLIQQIGRALRSATEGKKAETAYVFAPLRLVDRIEKQWDRYIDFEKYCAENTKHVVISEAALPDRLLRDMPDLQYVEGDFRPRFSEQLNIGDVKLPASGAIFDLSGSFDKQEIEQEVAEALLRQDRFKPIKIGGLPDNVVGVAYYGWQTSRLLTRHFFPEWTLGVCVLINEGNLVLAHDTEGIVFDAERLGLSRIAPEVLARGMPKSTASNAVRLSRISSASLDVSERAIRSQVISTHSFETTFTDLLNPGMVPTSAYGFVGRRGRYLGLLRARIRDAFPEPRPMTDYLAWAAEILGQFAQSNTEANPVFSRYARVSSPVSTDEAAPKSILFDFGASFSDHLADAADESRMARILGDADYADLCADVDDDGNFEVQIEGKPIPCQVEYRPKSRKYRVQSVELDQYFGTASEFGRLSASTLTQLLNREQLFRIIPAQGNVVYANGTFYSPQGFGPREDGTIPQLENVVSVPVLKHIDTEKGENLYGKDRNAWAEKSLFGLVKSISDHTGKLPAKWGDFGARASRFDLIVCDDDSTEVGDFLALNTKDRIACIIHAKAAKDLHSTSITAIEAVGRQALASLAFCSTVALAPQKKVERWKSDVYANKVPLTGLSRIFKNSQNLSVEEIDKAVKGSLTNRSWQREVWILAARLLDRAALEDDLRGKRTNRSWQMQMYLDTLFTACARGNTALRIYCH